MQSSQHSDALYQSDLSLHGHKNIPYTLKTLFRQNLLRYSVQFV